MEFLTGNVQELSPLVRVVLTILFGVLWDAVCLWAGSTIDELENERSSRDNTSSSRQTVGRSY